jgi:tetratricopeptide (TPR) repeat protein
MDLSQFDSIRTDYENLSAEQLEQFKIAEEERKERERATRKQEEIDQANAAVREAEKKFNAALQEAENYEKKGDYSGMIDLLNIALTIKPENAEAKQLLDEANRKLSEVKVKNEQYNKAIRAAQDAFTEQRWQDAYSKSETALELRPDSIEARRIKNDSQRKIKLAESVKEFLLRADTFIGQKLYQEAMEELEKAKLADASNKDISLRISKIKSIQLKHKNDVDTLIQQLTEAKGKKEFEKAVDLCNRLIDIDFTNQRKWSELIVSLKADWNKIKQDEELFANLKQQINIHYIIYYILKRVFIIIMIMKRRIQIPLILVLF